MNTQFDSSSTAGKENGCVYSNNGAAKISATKQALERRKQVTKSAFIFHKGSNETNEKYRK